ncbi:MAG TPA: aminoacetone oxidase family FAD-binding enzyme, partial [Atribacterota bacterium]|nr:aminoacetone oxidase family FAD-binding enzyme [Atribacterota bacterium]
NIQEIRKIGYIFEIVLKHAPSLYAQKIVVATGGRAAPQLGATGDGYHWALKLGHHLERQFPALVQLTTNISTLRLLNKLKLTEVVANLFIDDKLITSVKEDLLFLSNGISGTSVFTISRLASEALSRGKKVAVRINFTPDLNREELDNIFFSKKKSESFKPLSLLLQGILPEKLSQFILKECNIRFDSAISQLADSEIETIIANILDFYLPINGTQSWKYAQITCGGISVREVEPKTMESKLVPDLYFAGEILDVDGDCGGYNLQWAWSSGYLAGKSAVGNS